MPTRPRKGREGSNSGSKESGSQKATYGSSVSPEVSEGQSQAIEQGWDEAEPMEGEAPTG
jgi:hypothetical protein